MSDDEDCRLVIPERGTSVYVRMPYVVVENRSFKVSFLIQKLRISVVRPQLELVLIDNLNRVQIEFDDPEDIDSFYTYVRKLKDMSP